MLLQVLTGDVEREREKKSPKEKPKKEKKNRAENAHPRRCIWVFFFPSFCLMRTIDARIGEGNAGKSCRLIAIACLANERCQRQTERARDKYKKMTKNNNNNNNNDEHH